MTHSLIGMAEKALEKIWNAFGLPPELKLRSYETSADRIHVAATDGKMVYFGHAGTIEDAVKDLLADRESYNTQSKDTP